ncbi:MAG: M20/M25/M40 family metallo-hydrolase [Anaerolineae bacterium]|nr:M20/M25/M40 family metallo-hydrolase [Anaerolineae bacterium]
MTDIKRTDTYLDAHMDESIAELGKLCAIPSVAAQNTGMDEAAELVGNMLRQRGFSVQILPTGGAPVVVAERKGKRSEKTLMFYNHYDVQPAEPLELWESPPFEATLRDGCLYARGVSDDKGHITSRLFALDAMLAQADDLPCNIKFIVEGEEEIGSVHLPAFIEKNQELLAADACVWEFGMVNHEEVPMQYVGLRGICYVELSVKTADIDIHSGLGGSIFHNAAWRLVWALNTLKDEHERIRIPGFYDAVLPPSARDIELMGALPDVVEEYQTRYGVKSFLKGLTGGVDLRVAEVFEPTCTICGLTSGYQGPGSKTVLPAQASAKVDFRLVPTQTPKQVLEQLRAHLDAEGFPEVEITFLGGGPAGRTDPDDPFIQLVVDTAKDVYGVPMQIVPMIGGSGPNYPFVTVLNQPVATAGVGHPGTQAHAPNENVRLDLYLKHAKHVVRIIEAFANA